MGQRIENRTKRAFYTNSKMNSGAIFWYWKVLPAINSASHSSIVSGWLFVKLLLGLHGRSRAYRKFSQEELREVKLPGERLMKTARLDSRQQYIMSRLCFFSIQGCFSIPSRRITDNLSFAYKIVIMFPPMPRRGCFACTYITYHVPLNSYLITHRSLRTSENQASAQ